MKICIDAGHYGKYNQSPVDPAYYESEMTWALHQHLAKALRGYGIEVITTRTDQTKDLALTSRGRKAAGCDLFLSIHSNAVTDPKQDFPLACCCISGKMDALGLALAGTIRKVMQTAGEPRIWKRAGTGGGDYYGVLRGAAAVGVPGILLEHSCHTNAAAVKWLLSDSNLQRLAAAEAETIATYYGITRPAQPEEPEPPKTPEKPEDPGFKSYRVKVLDDALNIRKTPSWEASDITGVIRDHGVYTIVAETMLGKTKFGRLKSGAGWISLGSQYVKRL